MSNITETFQLDWEIIYSFTFQNNAEQIPHRICYTNAKFKFSCISDL